MKRRHKKRHLFIAAVFLMSITACLIKAFCVEYCIRDRQQKEEDAADLFLREYQKSIAKPSDTISVPFSKAQKGDMLFADSPVTESNYYSDGETIYTPDYAKGVLRGVLYIPEIGIKRGVYTGTPDEISYNLRIWMLVTARGDYEEGKTHLVIYGHTHSTQNLSFSSLINLKEGDVFYFVTKTEWISYRVREIFYLSREEVTEQISDNFKHPPSECYLVTCAGGDHQGLDLVIKGCRIEKADIPIKEYQDIRNGMNLWAFTALPVLR